MRRSSLARLVIGIGMFGAAAGLTTFHILQNFPGGQVWLSIVAALSAASSFAVVYWRDWRARSLVLVPRAVVLGVTVVLGAHLLFGFVFYLSVAILGFLRSDPAEISHLGAIAFTQVFAGGASLMNLPMTIPAGIVAALLFEVVDRDRTPLRTETVTPE